MSIKMLKKNCHQVLRSQKSKLTPIELVFETAGVINPPPTKIGLISLQLFSMESCAILILNLNTVTCGQSLTLWANGYIWRHVATGSLLVTDAASGVMEAVMAVDQLQAYQHYFIWRHGATCTTFKGKNVLHWQWKVYCNFTCIQYPNTIEWT